MKKLTLFTWGYWGWGNSTTKLVEAVDAIEFERGFKPPLFVDIRINRSVRAKGFNGNTFEEAVGIKRHRWMKSLGNKRIMTGTGPRIQIAEPESANELLDLAISSAKENRRVIFFCSCEWPCYCHRKTVATLVRKAAARRGISLETVEWPGGKPTHIHVELEPKLFQSVSKGRMYIPLNRQFDWAESGGPPWGSIASLHCGDETFHRLVGPVAWQKGKWTLPIAVAFFDPSTPISAYQKESAKFRKDNGLDLMTSG